MGSGLGSGLGTAEGFGVGIIEYVGSLLYRQKNHSIISFLSQVKFNEIYKTYGVGEALGSAVGSAVGSLVGSGVGFAEGLGVGFFDGFDEGRLVGGME